MACDYAINPMLLDADLMLPKDVLTDEAPPYPVIWA